MRFFFSVLGTLGLLTLVPSVQAMEFLRLKGLDTERIFLLHRPWEYPSSLFTPSDSLRLWRIEAQARFEPILDARGSRQTILASRLFGQAVWIRLPGGLDMALERQSWNEEISVRDDSAYTFSLENSRTLYALSLHYHLLRMPRHGKELDLAFHLHQGAVPAFTTGLRYRQGGYGLEFSLDRRDVRRMASAQDLSPEGTGGKPTGEYRIDYSSYFLSLSKDFADLRFSLGAGYAITIPLTPRTEYWLCDSSRQLDLLAQAEGRLGAWTWKLKGSYREAILHTFGRRIPAGSEGHKRYHYGRNGLLHFQEGMELGRTLGKQDGRGFHYVATSLGHGRFSFRGRPHPDALREKKESLSYNRLGLSFVADVFGGFSQTSESVILDLTAHTLEARPQYKWSFAGPGRIAASTSISTTLPLGLAVFDYRFADTTKTVGLFSTKIDRVYAFEMQPVFLLACPTLEARIDMGIFTGRMGVGQALAYKVGSLSHDTTGGESSGSKTRFPFGSNGLRAEAALVLRY